MQIDLTQIEPTELLRQSQRRRLATAGARTGFLSASLIILGLLVFFFYNFQTVLVSGRSMYPALRDRQAILICKALWLVGPLKRNDIVVARIGGGEYVVKRVYRLGGEVVDDLTLSPTGWDYFSQGYFRVPEGTVYLLGDNIFNSEDSRTFGPITEKNVVGKMVAN